MKSFSERNPLLVGVIGVTATVGIVVLSLQYRNLPFIDSARSYSAYFAEAGGLRSGAPVEVSGLRVGQVGDIGLEGSQVRVTFTLPRDVHVGDRTEAVIKTKSLLGAKFLEVIPRGEASLTETIPVARTTSPYQLSDALGDLTTTIGDLKTEQLSASLSTIAQTFEHTPPALQAALDGITRLSQAVNVRDEDLRKLLNGANAATGVLSTRVDQLVGLLRDSNNLLVELQSQSAAIDAISGNIAAASRELTGLAADNRDTLKPALDKLNGVLTILDNRKDKIQQSVKMLNLYAMSLGESVAAGPFFKAYLANLLPGQFMQPFVEAAFSDLGLDPAVLLPSQLSDPQVGQPASPALPVPFPRTGQGGEPRLTLPDAITGNPGDPRYPYRQPPPQPPAGGPPPGPPAGYDPNAPLPSTPALPTISQTLPPPVDVPAAGAQP